MNAAIIYYCDQLLQQPVRYINTPVYTDMEPLGKVQNGDGRWVHSDEVSPSESLWMYPLREYFEAASL